MRECIILAGGLGTRLQSVISDIPKCMAPVNGKPFLFYLFEWLEKNKFTRVILSLGYKSAVVIEFTQQYRWPFEIVWTIEQAPLGTGGAIAASLSYCKAPQVFIMNGDTFFDVDVSHFFQYHADKKADLTIAARPLTNYTRYGSLLCDVTGRITGFTEKRHTARGIINGGIYLLNLNAGLFSEKQGSFSFETGILETDYPERAFYAFADNGYFIDIGVPEDYFRAGEDFQLLFS